MSFLKKLFGQEPPPVAAPAAEPTEQQKSKAEFHRDRFARAIPECRAGGDEQQRNGACGDRGRDELCRPICGDREGDGACRDGRGEKLCRAAGGIDRGDAAPRVAGKQKLWRAIGRRCQVDRPWRCARQWRPIWQTLWLSAFLKETRRWLHVSSRARFSGSSPWRSPSCLSA